MAIEIQVPDVFTAPVKNCARCGGDHEAVEFKRFVNPAAGRTHWGTCPETGEPILMSVRVDGREQW